MWFVLRISLFCDIGSWGSVVRYSTDAASVSHRDDLIVQFSRPQLAVPYKALSLAAFSDA